MVYVSSAAGSGLTRFDAVSVQAVKNLLVF
jgi:hypothetical protein